MSIGVSELSAADVAAVCGNSGNRNNDGGMFGNDWAWIVILLLFGWGRNGFGGGFGGGYGATGGDCYCNPCATQADLAAGFNNSAVLSNLNDLALGQAGIQQTLSGFNGVTRQIADCCCDIKGGIKDIAYGNAMNTSAIQKQISDCCCDLEKANMQNRFDAQAYNCNTLQAIDKLGDRIIDYMSNEKLQTLRDENQALRLAASQSAQNAFITANQEAQTAELIRRLGRDVPVPAYVVPNPNCCYQYSVQPTCGCNTGCGSF